MRIIPFAVATAICLSTNISAQGEPDIRGWRTGASIGFADMGGDYSVGPGVSLGIQFNLAPTTAAVGFGFGYNASIHWVNGDQFVLHQLNASPRLTRISGGNWYQYIGLDGIITVWDFNFANPTNMAITENAQASGAGFGASGGFGGRTFGKLGFDVSAAYSVLWFANPREPFLTVANNGGGGWANVLRITVGVWYKGQG